MSRENVELVRAAYAQPDVLGAWVADRFASDAEFDLSDVYPEAPVLSGLDDIRRFRDSGPFGGSFHFEPERFFDVDDERVLVFLRVTAIGEMSGAPVAARPAHEFTIRNGLFARVKVYPDRDEALRANGLDEESGAGE